MLSLYLLYPIFLIYSILREKDGVKTHQSKCKRDVVDHLLRQGGNRDKIPPELDACLDRVPDRRAIIPKDRDL